ncbi:MAG: tetratricopeptide repeat protein [Hyphomicrobiaceae bacterium]|nr:tetratricopeptide repeat protein [Hyphomicrobiaceae bacterium]
MPSPDRQTKRASHGAAGADDFELSAAWDAEGIAALKGEPPDEPQRQPAGVQTPQGDWPSVAPWLADETVPATSAEDRSWLDRKLADIAARLEGTLRQQDPAPALMRFGERLDNFEARVEAAVERANRSEDRDSLRFIEAQVREMDAHFDTMRGQIARLATMDARVAEIWNHVQLDLPAPAAGLAGLVEGAVTRALTAASVLRSEASQPAGQSLSVTHLARIEDALGRLIERVEAIEEASVYLRSEDPWAEMDRLDAAYSQGLRALGGMPESAAWSRGERGHVLHAEDYSVPSGRRIHSLAEVLPAEPLAPPAPQETPTVPAAAPAAAAQEPPPAAPEPAPAPAQAPSTWNAQSVEAELEELRQSALRPREQAQWESGGEIAPDDAGDGHAPARHAAGRAADLALPDEEPAPRTERADPFGSGHKPMVPLAEIKRPLSQGRWYRGFFLGGAMLAVGGASFMIVAWSMSGTSQRAAVPAVPTEAATTVAQGGGRPGEESRASPVALPPVTDMESPGAAARAATLPATIASASLRHAAANGDPAAEFEIAARYADGRGVSPDLQQAFVWYQRSAMHGYAPAQFRLGAYYERGIGTEKDVERAKLWYRRAAEKGHVKAMHNIAVLLTSAMPKPDFAGAAQWFREAAERNVADSQFNLAMLYETGRGVPENQAEAYKWYAIALRNGDLEAGRRMEFVRGRLSKGEIAAVEKAVGSWLPTPMSAMPGSATSERAAP